MKFALVFFVVAVFVAGSLAQNRGSIDKGGKCTRDEDCLLDARDMKCVNDYCGCRKGLRQEYEQHLGGPYSYVCSPVVGRGCERHEQCSVDMDNAECNLTERRCECNSNKGCINLKDKGESCSVDEECIFDIRRMRCAGLKCGCEKGQRQLEKSTPGSSSTTLVCEKVVGSGCTRDDDCSVDLEHATCNPQSQTCECKKENGCNGASTMAIISFLPMVFVSVGLLKYW